MRTPRPAMVAALDQAASAVRDARLRQQDAARQHGAAVFTPPDTPALRRMLRPLNVRADAGQLTRCSHLPGSGPTPTAVWLPFRPGRLRCGACAARALDRITGTREDHRCDSCRRLASSLATCWLSLPALVTDHGDGPPTTAGPISVVFGLCSACEPDRGAPAVVTEPDRLESSCP